MKSLRALIKKKKLKSSSAVLILSLFVVTAGCSLDESSDNQAAKVDDKVLSNKKLDSLESSEGNKKFSEELKREWVEKEVLYKEAISKGIIDTKEFKEIMQQSKKELASAILLKNHFAEHEILYTESELRLFYENNKEDFRQNEKAFAVNLAKFTDGETAITFRKRLSSVSWNNALKHLSDEDSLLISFQEQLFKEFEFPSRNYRRIASALAPGEISIVLEDKGDFAVLEVLQVVDQNEVPDYQYIKENVKNLYLASERSKLYNDYLENLYSKYNVEIN